MDWLTGSIRRVQQQAESAVRFAVSAAASVETPQDLEGARPSVLPLQARLYIAGMSLAACYCLVQAFQTWHPEVKLPFLLYLVIAVASSGMKVRPPGVKGNISVNYVFTLLCLLEFQLAETMTLAALGAIVQTFWFSRRNKMLHLAFNMASIVVTVKAASLVFALPLFTGWREGEFLRLTLAGIVYFIVNTL